MPKNQINIYRFFFEPVLEFEQIGIANDYNTTVGLFFKIFKAWVIFIGLVVITKQEQHRLQFHFETKLRKPDDQIRVDFEAFGWRTDRERPSAPRPLAASTVWLQWRPD